MAVMQIQDDPSWKYIESIHIKRLDFDGLEYWIKMDGGKTSLMVFKQTTMEYHITGLSEILDHLKEKLPSELYLEMQKFYFRII